MTLDINELRKDKRPQSSRIVHEILDRLKAAEKERDKLKELNSALCRINNSQVIHNARLAEENYTLRAKISDLTINVEYLGNLKKSYEELIGELQDEIDALRAALRHEADCVEAAKAEIEAMEKQEPVAWATKLALEYGASTLGFRVSSVNIWGEKGVPLYALPVAQQCKNCNGMGDRFDPSGEKIPCDLCESHLEEIRSLVAEAAHDIISGSDFWLSTSLAAKKIYALPGAQTQGEKK